MRYVSATIIFQHPDVNLLGPVKVTLTSNLTNRCPVLSVSVFYMNIFNLRPPKILLSQTVVTDGDLSASKEGVHMCCQYLRLTRLFLWQILWSGQQHNRGSLEMSRGRRLWHWRLRGEMIIIRSENRFNPFLLFVCFYEALYLWFLLNFFKLTLYEWTQWWW